MPALLTLHQFEPLLHKRFLVQVDERSTFEVELIEVRALPSQPMREGAPPARAPFSLIFRGPRESYVPQRMYALRNEVLGTQEFFLVPIGPDERGHRYQAIFN
jgi:hypothetical protein